MGLCSAAVSAPFNSISIFTTDGTDGRLSVLREALHFATKIRKTLQLQLAGRRGNCALRPQTLVAFDLSRECINYLFARAFVGPFPKDVALGVRRPAAIIYANLYDRLSAVFLHWNVFTTAQGRTAFVDISEPITVTISKRHVSFYSHADCARCNFSPNNTWDGTPVLPFIVSYSLQMC